MFGVPHVTLADLAHVVSADNLEEEMDNIRHLIDKYTHVAMVGA